jgi:hypothetical protein
MKREGPLGHNHSIGVTVSAGTVIWVDTIRKGGVGAGQPPSQFRISGGGLQSPISLTGTDAEHWSAKNLRKSPQILCSARNNKKTVPAISDKA